MDLVSKDEYLEWVGNRVTKRFLQDIFNKREELKEGVVELHESSDQERFISIGRCQALRDVIDWAVREFDYEGKYQDDMASGSTSDNS